MDYSIVIRASSVPIRDLGGSAGTVEVTQAIRNALTTSAIAA